VSTTELCNCDTVTFDDLMAVTIKNNVFRDADAVHSCGTYALPQSWQKSYGSAHWKWNETILQLPLSRYMKILYTIDLNRAYRLQYQLKHRGTSHCCLFLPSFGPLLNCHYWSISLQNTHINSKQYPVVLMYVCMFIIIKGYTLRVAGNTFNKQSRRADKGWSSSLGVGRGAKTSSP
jgi:hypothetical protein